MRFSIALTLVVDAVFSMILTSAAPVQARPQSISILKGQVLQYGEAVPRGLTIEVRKVGGYEPPERVSVMGDGSFELHGLDGGEYEVKIMNAREDIIQQDLVHVGTNLMQLTLQLRSSLEGFAPSKSLSGTVSVRQLHNPIPRKAEKEFRLSCQAFSAGDINKSREHLEKAIHIYPDYMEAHNNLGSRYMALHQYESALTEFQKAVAIDPGSTKGHLNLAIASTSLHRYSDAEAAARKALEIDSSFASAHYVLGQILTVQNKDLPEALEHLHKAVDQYPKARLVVAQVLARRGSAQEAAAELRAYLKSGSPDKRQEVESWLARLERP